MSSFPKSSPPQLPGRPGPHFRPRAPLTVFHTPGGTWRSRLALVGLVFVIHLPFLNQAYHIDDRIYLEVARNIYEKPLYPYDFDALYEGFVAPDAASHSHLPFTSYYLAVVQLAGGLEREWVAHLAFLIFPLLSALAFYELARMLVSFPFAAAALLVSSTSFLTLSNTLMPDVPLLAFWILALASWHHFLAHPSCKWSWRLCLAAVLVASFMSLLTFALLLLLATDWLLQRRARLWTDERLLRVGVVLLAPFLLWTLWYLRAYLYYDRFVLVNTFLHMEQRTSYSLTSVATKLLSFGLHLGGTFVFPLAAWIAFTGRTSRKIYIAVFFLAFIPAYLWHPDWPWIQAFLFAMFSTTGFLALLKIAQVTGRLFLHFLSPGKASREIFWNGPTRDQNRDRLAMLGVLFLWFWGILLACSLVFYSGSARYSVLALPPFLLLFQCAIETGNAWIRARSHLLVSLALTLFYSLLVAAADHRFAESYREESARLVREFERPDRRIWYAGEWGFRFYMDQLGARPLTQAGTEPEVGDIIIKPYIALPWITLFDSEEFVVLVEQRQVQAGSPLRILDFHSSAGFYSTAWGILPISITQQKRWEWFNVFQVKKKFDGPIPVIKRPW